MADIPTGNPPKAKRDNRNGIRHGLKAGKLPEGCQHIENTVNELRRQLEDAVIAARGEVTLLDAAAIQTAVKWERHGALALRWLREAPDLKPMEQLSFSREIARASSERDKALAGLNLAKTRRSASGEQLPVWEDIYEEGRRRMARQLQDNASPAEVSPDSASEPVGNGQAIPGEVVPVDVAGESADRP